MTRRNILKTRELAALAAALPDADIGAWPAKGTLYKPTTGHFKFKLGELDMMIVTDGDIVIYPAQPIIAPGIDPDQVETALSKARMKDNEVDAAINILVIFKEGRIIVFDAGSGQALGDNSGRFLENLHNAGIQPAQITDVLITHLHIDHIGGLLAGDGKLVFPDAYYHMPQAEHDFWMSPRPDFSRSKNTASQESSIALARRVVEAIRDRLNLFEFGDTLFDCIKTESATGHTPGHPLLTIFSNGQELKHVVDFVHTSLLISHPEWGTLWDTDFDKGVATRRRILADLAASDTLVLSCHLPWPGLGHVSGDNLSGYYWNPKLFSTPQLYDRND